MEIHTGTIVPSEPAIDLVKVLSEGTYTSFAQALKELISNSYDADAHKVTLQLDDELTALTVHDDGLGMSKDEFKHVFMSIARGRSHSSSQDKTAGGRRRIGRFGLGSLSIVGTAAKLTVRSIKKGTGEGFQASIDLEDLKTHFGKGEDLSSWWRFSSTEWTGEPLTSHSTQITLEGLRDDIKELLQTPGQKQLGDFFSSTSALSGLEQLRWKLGIICPVKYANEYPIPASELDENEDKVIVKRSAALVKDNFDVFLNGESVLRQITLPSYHPKKWKNAAEYARLVKRGLGFDVRCFDLKQTGVKCEGYLVVQASGIFPEELRGILVRIRGVGIGWHRSFNLTSTAATMLSSMSGEVWVEGIDDALQFNRESFHEDRASYVRLRGMLQSIVDEESKGFRERSQLRMAKSEKKTGKKKKKSENENETNETESPAAADSFVNPEIFDQQRDHIRRLVPQVNGCYDRQWYEACAMVVRRLVETLILHLYERKGWLGDLTDANGDLFGLKKIINTVSSDTRLGLEKKTLQGLGDILGDLKSLGDTAAHDYKVKIRKQDLDSLRKPLRFTCERLIFKIEETTP